jgi:hypothetical protein
MASGEWWTYIDQLTLQEEKINNSNFLKKDYSELVNK